MVQVVFERRSGGRVTEKSIINTRNAGFIPRPSKAFEPSGRMEGEQLLPAHETTARQSPTMSDFAKLYERPAPTQQPKARVDDRPKRTIYQTSAGGQKNRTTFGKRHK
ncbi:MAG: hypothetical protein JWL87_78 [Candidatus Adlerbacteria bacterium]|nr:hypothetical protein [Candidatus Adlerbacteria bacterium]